MKIAGITIVLLTTLIGAAKAAQDTPPTFITPDTSNPAVAAFVAWHAALVKGDFASYRDLTPVVPNITNDLLKQMFDQTRQTTPKIVKITEPKLNDRGSVGFHSVGCNGNQPVVGIIAVRKIDQKWRVGGAWGPSWNPKISEIVKCP
jgi:hypothetical protein